MIQFFINLFNNLFNKKSTVPQPEEQVKITNIDQIDMSTAEAVEIDTLYLFL